MRRLQRCPLVGRLCLAVTAALILSACTAGAPPIAEPRLIPPASLTELPPETLPQPASNSLEDLTTNHIEVAGMYHRLRERFKGLVEWLEVTSEIR